VEGTLVGFAHRGGGRLCSPAREPEGLTGAKGAVSSDELRTGGPIDRGPLGLTSRIDRGQLPRLRPLASPLRRHDSHALGCSRSRLSSRR